MSFRSAAELTARPELMAPPELVEPPCAVAGRSALVTLGPKGGKSTTAAGILANASRNGRSVALLTLDEALPDSLQRLVRFGAVLERVYLADTFEPASLSEELATLGIEILVLDHLGKLAERSPDFGPNSHGDPVLWGRLVSPFLQLAREQYLAVILLDQARRSDGKWAGSVGKGGNVDFLCELEPKDGGLACTPRGRTPLPPFRVDLDSEGRPVFTTATGEALRPARANAITEEDRLEVLAALRSAEPEGLTATGWQQVVKERCGFSRSTFFEIRRRLYSEGLLTYASRLYRVARNGDRQLAEAELEAAQC